MWKHYIVWAARAVAGLGLLVTVLLHFLILVRPATEPDQAMQYLNMGLWLLVPVIPLYIILGLIQAGELPALWPPNADRPVILFDPRQGIGQWFVLTRWIVIFGLIEIGVLVYAFYLYQTGGDAGLSAAEQRQHNEALSFLVTAQFYAIALFGFLRVHRTRYL